MSGLLLYAIIGIAVGCIGALLGIGGGVIIVPFLTFVFDFPPQVAVGTSMCVVMLNSIGGAYGYWRQGKIYADAAWKFALATIPGAYLGGYVSDRIQGDVFYVIFGIFFIALAANMFFKASKRQDKNQMDTVPENYNWKLGTSLSVGVGFLASILGIGGGVIHVPMMTYILKFPVKIAIATSTAILAVSAVSGTVSHVVMGHVSMLPALGMGIGAIIGAQLGVRFAGKSRSELLMKLLSLLVFAMGVKFLSTLF